MKSQSGNVIVFILIAVVLFGALSMAVTQTSRTGADTDRERQILDESELKSYQMAIRNAERSLSLLGCVDFDYSPPELQDPSASTRCVIFSPGAGGVTWMDFGATCPDDAILENLPIGGRCGMLVYAGESGGNRLYTTAVDQAGVFRWGPTSLSTGATSTADGLENTDILIALGGHPAAESCRSLGAEWYLPSTQELNVLCANHEEIENFTIGTSEGTVYWSSTQATADRAHYRRFTSCSGGNVSLRNKYRNNLVRCVRR